MQREVFVSTMGTIYNVQNAAEHGMTGSLRDQMRQDIEPSTGRHTFTSLTALCVMVYYVLSMQCLSTVVVLRRETNGWKWPLVQIGYMTALAYSVTFAAFTLGTILGMGG
jgi:ferrous iron transport protein B